jgi:transposase
MEESGKQRTKDKEQELARERALVILRVRSGAMTAKQGAQALGVSRKTYYQWEDRALKAMALALENRVAGRPCVSTDEEKVKLFNTMLAYSGTYTVEDDRVIHHVDAAWNPAWLAAFIHDGLSEGLADVA